MHDAIASIASEHEALIQFLYMAPVGLTQTTVDGDITLINPISAQLLMPLSRDGSLVNLFDVLEGVAPDLRHAAAAFEGTSGMICEGQRIQISAGVRGKARPQMLSLTLLKLDENRLMAVLNDVTQQVLRERLLKQNEAWFHAIMTGITDYALVSLDARGRVVDWNESIGRVTGFTREAVIGRPYALFYPEDAITPDRLGDRLREADDNGWSLDDGWRIKADGTRFWGSAMIAPLVERHAARDDDIRAPDDPAYCLVIRDITDKREASESFRAATCCDHLTGIANRRAFFDAAELELERWRRAPRGLALALFDVDHFKRINDAHGHPAGDAVLRHLAKLLSSTFRQVDIVARIGGEEFAVLLPSADLQAATGVANRLRELAASQTVAFDGTEIRYTVSGGVAVMESGTGSLDDLIKRADRALYAAKEMGRNRVECGAPQPAVSVSD